MKRLLMLFLCLLVLPSVATGAPTAIYPDPKILEDIKTLGFDVTIDVDTPCEPGILKWNSDDGTLDICTNISGHTIQIGQEVAPRVVNKSGSTILNGQVINITGAQGNRIAAGLANAADPQARVIGVATSDIEDNAEGPVVLIGKARGIDTRNWSAGDFLYLSATEDGAITNSIPDSPNRKVFIGIAENSTVSGSIWVTISNGRPIGGNHDVALAASLGPPDDSTLLYNATSSTWEPVPHTYGEMYYHNDAGTLDFSTNTDLINVTGLTNGVFSNMALNETDGSITVIDADTYTCDASVSFQSASAGDFDHHLGVNGIDQDKCHASRRIGTGTDTGNIGMTCILELSSNDVITLMVNSAASETVKYENLNYNCDRDK
jgi:hypothetical protein